MYVSVKWLQDLLGIQRFPLSSLIDRLTLCGIEVEEITYKHLYNSPDIILDINFTANRYDVSNIKGLMTEISSVCSFESMIEPPKHIYPLTNLIRKKCNLRKIQQLTLTKKLRTKRFTFFFNYKLFFLKNLIWENYLQTKNPLFSNLITVNSGCSRLSRTILFSRKSQQLQVKQSPRWMMKRLMAVGSSPTNNITDTMNILSLESGQIFFGFDLTGIGSNSKNLELGFIPSSLANSNSVTHSCTERPQKIKFNEKFETITFNSHPISIVGGLLQEENTFVNKTTSEIVVQFGLYDSRQVKESSKHLGLKTDSSLRLQKPIYLNLLEQAYLKLIHLFQIQGIRFEKEGETNPRYKAIIPLFSPYLLNLQTKLKISYDNINNLVGVDKELNRLSKLQVQKSLRLLNFKYFIKTQHDYYILIPLFRQSDIEREIDIVEEIVRMKGFDAFPSFLPKENSLGQTTKFEKFKRRIRMYLLDSGFSESLHPSLIYESNLYQVKAKNSLLQENSSLRTSLLTSLFEKISFNKRNTGKVFETFTFGRIYTYISGQNIKERKELEILSGIFGAKEFRFNWENSTYSSLSWFEAKGLIERIFYKLNLRINWKFLLSLNDNKNFHPNLTAHLLIGKQILGTFGRIHPNLCISNDIAKQTYIFELNLDVINQFWENKALINYFPFSSYPTSSINLSFIVKKNIPFEAIRHEILLLGQPLIKSVILFDYYSKFPIASNYCSLSFKLEFQSNTQTLLSSELDKVVKSIVAQLERTFNMLLQ